MFQTKGLSLDLLPDKGFTFELEMTEENPNRVSHEHCLEMCSNKQRERVGTSRYQLLPDMHTGPGSRA